MAKTGTVVDVNRMMASGTMYTYVLIAVDGAGVQTLRGSASSYADLAFAQFGQRVTFDTSGSNVSSFSIDWTNSPRPWEGDVRMPGANKS